MRVDDTFLKKVLSLGTLGYSFHKCVNVLDISEKDRASFYDDWGDAESKIAKAYNKGVDQADYAIDLKLFEKARNGDLKALDMYERRKHERAS